MDENNSTPRMTIADRIRKFRDEHPMLAAGLLAVALTPVYALVNSQTRLNNVRADAAKEMTENALLEREVTNFHFTRDKISWEAWEMSQLEAQEREFEAEQKQLEASKPKK